MTKSKKSRCEGCNWVPDILMQECPGFVHMDHKKRNIEPELRDIPLTFCDCKEMVISQHFGMLCNLYQNNEFPYYNCDVRCYYGICPLGFHR
jgi:hypothetical protein